MMVSEDGVSALSGTCVTINMLMGSGFLALPAVFQKTGLMFSVTTLIVVGFVMYITCCWEGRAALRGQYKLSLPKVPEVTETLRLFCGNFASNSYLFILSVSFVGAVWAYAILFAESLSSNLPLIYPHVECVNGDISTDICYMRYLLNLFIFACITTVRTTFHVCVSVCVYCAVIY
jgi:amino acid permease